MTILLNERKAAAELDVSARLLRKLRSMGEIEYIKIGGAIRYSVEDLRAFVEGKRVCESIEEKPAPITGPVARPKVVDIAAARKKHKRS